MTPAPRPLLLLVAALWVAACASPAPSAPPGIGSRSASLTPVASASAGHTVTPTVMDAAAGISFQRPADWRRWQPNDHSALTPGPLIYLSTDPLRPTCAVTPDASPNPPDSQGQACDWPLTSLSANGVLVTWWTTRILLPFPSFGDPIVVNGKGTRLQVELPGCAAIGADEAISVLVPIGASSTLSNIEVGACLRGPDLATTEAQVRSMLASATVGP